MRRRIRLYERRYEIPTAQMLEEVEAGQMRETAEILKWMFAYRVLEWHERENPTGGSGLTATARSTRNGSKSAASQTTHPQHRCLPAVRVLSSKDREG